MTLLADTGFVYAVINVADQNHQMARDYYLSNSDTMLLAASALTELAYLIARKADTASVVAGLRFVRSSDFELVDLVDEDYERALAILDQYNDSRIDFVDACIMAMAERLKVTSILTFDRRDFGLYRPAHVEHFELLP